MYDLRIRPLGHFDVAVVGGGVAGVAAAVTAARQGASVILIERSGVLGGTLTDGFVPRIIDGENKGGVMRELFAALNGDGATCRRFGKKTDENGKNIPGDLVDIEACKYYFDKMVCESGVKLIYYSQVAAVEMNGRDIASLLVSTEYGNLAVEADVYIDASGHGSLADMAGCRWECGHPDSGVPQPVSVGVCTVGMPEGYTGTDTTADKDAYGAMLKSHGIHVSADQANVIALPSGKTWVFAASFGYGVRPDDIETLTAATVDGRREGYEVIREHKRIEGYDRLAVVYSSPHVGIREGRRIIGDYRISNDDIAVGKRFEDAICLVTFTVDVHKMSKDDTTDCRRGVRTKPYNIPYRALLPKDCDNLLLAGRCISGDFFPHASYRVMGNMVATGEAAGFAAAKCAKFATRPRLVDGKEVSDYMRSVGYEI